VEKNIGFFVKTSPYAKSGEKRRFCSKTERFILIRRFFDICLTIFYLLPITSTGGIKMPRPTNKQQLLELAETNFNKLLEFIDALPAKIKNGIYKNNELNERDKTIADVICHLHEWHLMMGNWYKVGMSGKKPAIPAEDVTWQTLPVLNQRIYEKYKGTELKNAIAMFKKSHKEVMTLIEKHTDSELFTKKKYQWTGTTSLGAYLISATSSHYDWGLKTIKPLKKLV
jgi:hypothetical protein